VRRSSLSAGIGALGLALGAAAVAVAQSPADSAWNKGDLPTAQRLYEARLASDSSDVRALHRLALINAWDDRYDESVTLFNRLLRTDPSNLEARRDRARVLSWAGRFPESIAAYDTLARMSDNDRPARLGQAQALSWAGELDSSAAIYRRLLAANPSDLEARRGLARVTSWSGKLVLAEAEWRKAVAADSNDVASLVGLAQTLRWQGRTAAAVPYLERGRRLAPDDRDLTTEWRYAEAAAAPRVGMTSTRESDSDGNQITTVSARAAWRPQGRVEVGVEGYFRRGTWDTNGFGSRDAQGGLVDARVDLEPGWIVAAGAGASTAGSGINRTTAQWRASISSPGRYHVGGGLTVRHAALDATALLIERGVVMQEVALSLRAEPATGWSLNGALSHATFTGTQDNARTVGFVAAMRHFARRWTAGVRLRALGYRYDLNDGYFDPSRYVIAEVPVRWHETVNRWSLQGEVAPGVQQVGRGGSIQATGQASAAASFAVAPGRDIGVSALFSRSGLQAFATPEAGYRYLSLGLSANWWF
jgi:tetratricopeptide (TPR) repeat protein